MIFRLFGTRPAEKLCKCGQKRYTNKENLQPCSKGCKLKPKGQKSVKTKL